ncbi:nicotinate phosphoribosyltransferase [Aestuariicella hydrocarbonica]|uniref:Nicotinate phosphoribosyltransferase n=1 Tax=Pseudomaricurvus hydrocarbonicus TaxID=1470433 RepID=A0A9E5MM35_9GAMM|nr:nicotinate phosphoribosyltransferase [Aestuariicella hydrocarbonica]NHO66173.1 nicotinate phosphoribosyltransferase [Aestuariicella hydrocarbonica]
MRQKGEPIITSLLDTDKYKFSMQQVNLHQYPRATARYRFKLRDKDIDLTPIAAEVKDQLAMVAELRFQEDELRYLSEEPHLSAGYIDFLSDFTLDTKHIQLETSGGNLNIYTEGSMLKGGPWELYVLPIVSEVWYRHTIPEPNYEEGRRRLSEKISLLKSQGDMPGFNFADFGSRRRFSKAWQAEVIRTLRLNLSEYFVGTSNYHFAMEQGLIPVGTMAHEYLQAWQGLVHPLDAQKAALDAWAQEFRGCLGDALTDVIGMDSFCDLLDLYLAKQFDGFRHDSGCPELWCEKLIQRLHALKVDPKTKRAIWSDGLSIPGMVELYRQFQDKIQVGFGIGTNLTNDLGYRPLNIVMKLTEVNGRPVAKLSDSPGKIMCEDPDYVAWLANSYGRKAEFVC